MEYEYEEMNVKDLYEYLNSESFQKVVNGNIFYNYYIFQYRAYKEYDMREQIKDFIKNLVRPTSYLEPMDLDLFSLFCDYLRNEKFGDNNLLDETFDEEKNPNNLVTQELTAEANSDGFIKYVHNTINKFVEEESPFKRVYVFIHGIGKMFPYMRTNVFLTKYEKYNDPNKYKIILFYPGHQEGNSFSLFDELEDSHTYRATLLVNRKIH